MFKEELIRLVATKSNYTNKSVGEVLAALTESIAEALKKGQEVRIIEFGVFKAQRKRARAGRNPKTGATIKIPAKTLPKFIPGTMLVNAVKNSKHWK